MNANLFRGLALACFAIFLALATIWLLQELDMVALVDDPVTGVIAFGLIGMAFHHLGKRARTPPEQ